MPDARASLERGLRLERGGVLDGALQAYATAADIATDPADRAEALRRQADVLRTRAEWGRALELARESAHVAGAAGLNDLLAEAINAQAAVRQCQGDLDAAARLYGQIPELSSDRRIRGIAHQNLGALAAMAGRHEEAALRFEESLTCFRASGYTRGVAIALVNLGRAALDQDDAVRAETVLRDAAAAAREVDDLDLAALALVNLAEAVLERGGYDQAEEHASSALGFFKVSGNRWRQIECLRMIGDIRRARGEADVARRSYTQALELARSIGAEPEIASVTARLGALDR